MASQEKTSFLLGIAQIWRGDWDSPAPIVCGGGIGNLDKAQKKRFIFLGGLPYLHDRHIIQASKNVIILPFHHINFLSKNVVIS